MAYRVGGTVDENHIPADLVEQDLLVNHEAVRFTALCSTTGHNVVGDKANH